jgi:O-antigen/teichoic acid export membrane protein
MRVSTRIVINALTSWAATLTRAAIGVVLVPFLLVKLGTEGYGLVALLGATMASTRLLDLGLRNALGRQLAEQVARNDVEGFNQLASTAFALFLMIGTLFGAGCLLAAPWLAVAFNIPDALMAEAVFAIRWYGAISIVLSFLTPVFSASLASQHRFDVVHAANMGASILQGLSLLAVLGLTQAGVYGWIAVMLASEALRLMITSHLAHRVCPTLVIGPGQLRGASLRPLLSLGRWMYALQVTHLLGERADPIVITAFYGPAGVAIYSPALALHGVVRPLVSVLSAQLFPIATDAYVTGSVRDLQEVLIRGTRYTLLMGIPFCVVLGVFATPIMQVWLEDSLGADYRIAANVLVGWAIVDLLTSAGGAQYPLLLGMNRLRFLVLLGVPAGVINVLLSIWLVGYTSWGIVGVIVATAAVSAVFRPIATAYAARCCALPLHRYFAEAYLRPLLVLAMLTAIGLAARQLLLPFAGIAMLAAGTATIGAAWAALCWWVGFADQDRLAGLKIVDRVLDRIRPARGPGAVGTTPLGTERPAAGKD